MIETAKVYGSRVSYYTGKLETYLRYKGIPYVRRPLYPDEKRVRAHLGTTQMPAVELADGRWMSDSTPIILHFETRHPDPPIMPTDPAVRFIALLIEDYADEWLWRPAMHYRWSYRHDREHLSSLLVDEQTTHMPLPRSWKRWAIARRQRRGFVIGDGVSEATRPHVEGGYFAALANMTEMLSHRPFLLGDAPSIADIGLMGPMLRHFGQDPTPVELMRERAPAVYEWVARMWNARPLASSPTWIRSLTDDARSMLNEVCDTHLAQLAHNATAFEQGSRRFGVEIQGCAYRELPVSRYRVFCLEELRRRFEGLREEDRARVRSWLPWPTAEILWATDFSTKSGYDDAREAPFNMAINVYGNGVPR